MVRTLMKEDSHPFLVEKMLIACIWGKAVWLPIKNIYTLWPSITTSGNIRYKNKNTIFLFVWFQPGWEKIWGESACMYMYGWVTLLCAWNFAVPLNLYHSIVNWLFCCSVTQSHLTLCDPVGCSTPSFPVHHQLPELTQTRVHRASDANQPSHPLLSPSPPAFNLSQHQNLFKWVSSSHQVAKVLERQH